MNDSLCKVQECVETPFTEQWSIIQRAKIKDFHTTITHIDNKTITVWLVHKQEKNECGLSQHISLWKSLFVLNGECHILCHQKYIKL